MTALAETVNGLFKAELIRRQGPWRTADQVELATLGWVDWWNRRRLHGAIGDVPPAEYEAAYYHANHGVEEVAWTNRPGLHSTRVVHYLTLDGRE